MQVLPIGAESCRRIGVEEKLIKFRPSPNFKNMKKFMKSKFGFPVHTSPNNDIDDSPPPSTTDNNHPSPSIQPPLPLGPPPPDSPDKDNEEVQTEATIKKETEDLEPEEAATSTESVEPAPVAKSVCRDFIRGTCTRPDCRYLHEYDLSQLNKVYTFCRNYQNSACTLPNCRYAHASVFEEQAFYRTGVLPPHALAHHKNNVPNSNGSGGGPVPNVADKNFMLQPPPPPPPPPQPDAPPQELPQTMMPLNITNVPPALHMGGDNLKAMPMMTCMPQVLLPTNANTLKDAVCGNTSPQLKRNWAQHEEFNASPRGQEVIAKRPNKCENCLLLDNRMQYTKEILEGLTKSTIEINEKMNELERKSNRLLTCIMSAIKPMASQGIMQSHNSLGSIYQTFNLTDDLSMFNDQDKVSLMTDQLKQFVQVRMAKLNSEDKTIKAFPMSAGNNVQSNQSSVNVATLNTSRQLTNLFNSWGNHHP